MRFEVPQFIEIEDKIFGPFTWRQFVYLSGGVGIAAVILLTTPIFVFALVGLPIAGLSFALAFYPVNNRPFSVFLESIFRFYNSNRTYHWKRNSKVVYRNLNSKPVDSNSTPVVTTNSYNNNGMSQDINSLSRKLELNALQKEI